MYISPEIIEELLKSRSLAKSATVKHMKRFMELLSLVNDPKVQLDEKRYKKAKEDFLKVAGISEADLETKKKIIDRIDAEKQQKSSQLVAQPDKIKSSIRSPESAFTDLKSTSTPSVPTSPRKNFYEHLERAHKLFEAGRDDAAHSVYKKIPNDIIPESHKDYNPDYIHLGVGPKEWFNATAADKKNLNEYHNELLAGKHTDPQDLNSLAKIKSSNKL